MNKKLIFLLAMCCYKAAASSQQSDGPFGIRSSNSQIMAQQDSSLIDWKFKDYPSQNLPMTDSVGQQTRSIIPEDIIRYFPTSSSQLPIRTNYGLGSKYDFSQYPMNNQLNNQPEQNYLQGTQGNNGRGNNQFFASGFSSQQQIFNGPIYSSVVNIHSPFPPLYSHTTTSFSLPTIQHSLPTGQFQHYPSGNSDTCLMLPQGGYGSNSSMNNCFAPGYSLEQPYSFNAPIHSSLINNSMPIVGAVQSYSESSFTSNPSMTGNQPKGNYDSFVTGANNSPLFKKSVTKKKKRLPYSQGNYSQAKSVNNLNNHAGKVSEYHTISQPSVVPQYPLNKGQGFSQLNDSRAQACTDLTPPPLLIYSSSSGKYEVFKKPECDSLTDSLPPLIYHYDKASSLTHKNAVLNHELQGAQPQENAFLDTNDNLASLLKECDQVLRMVNDDTLSTFNQGALSLEQLSYLRSLGLDGFLPKEAPDVPYASLTNIQKFAAIEEAHKHKDYAGKIKVWLGKKYSAFFSNFISFPEKTKKELLVNFENSRMLNPNGLK